MWDEWPNQSVHHAIPVSRGCVWPQCCRDVEKRSCPQYSSVSGRNVGQLISRKLPQALVIDRCDEPGGRLCVGSWVPDGTGSPCFCVCVLVGGSTSTAFGI